VTIAAFPLPVRGRADSVYYFKCLNHLHAPTNGRHAVILQRPAYSVAGAAYIYFEDFEEYLPTTTYYLIAPAVACSPVGWTLRRWHSAAPGTEVGAPEELGSYSRRTLVPPLAMVAAQMGCSATVWAGISNNRWIVFGFAVACLVVTLSGTLSYTPLGSRVRLSLLAVCGGCCAGDAATEPMELPGEDGLPKGRNI